jgi:hypothetical protein
MRLYAAVALAGIFLAATQPVPRPPDGRAEKERAIAGIKKLGGKVEVDTKSPGMPVVGVDLRRTPAVDASLEHLKGLRTMKSLLLEDTTVTDDGMVYLKGLTNLEALELGRTRVTDKALGDLKGFSKLQRLDLGGTRVSDSGLVHLKGLANLRELNLVGTKVTDAGVRDLQKALPRVKIRH